MKYETSVRNYESDDRFLVVSCSHFPTFRRRNSEQNNEYNLFTSWKGSHCSRDRNLCVFVQDLATFISETVDDVCFS